MEDALLAQDWLYDNFEATKIQYIEKLDELKSKGDVVAWRAKEEWKGRVPCWPRHMRVSRTLCCTDALI
eukprot:705812-Amphidinium_carterae.1